MRRALTLVELVVAMGLGLLVAYIAYAAFRMSAQTMAVTNRLALENRLMRTGYLHALDDLDFWTLYDDPADPARQGLRRNATVNAPHGTVPQGLPFTPLAATPVWSDVDPADPATPQPYQPVAWRLRPGDPLLESAAQLDDGDRVLLRDADRGWDAARPYQANDPRGWWRGAFGESFGSDVRMGRYGLFTNKRRFPVLGVGASANRAYTLSGGTWTATSADTGPYGPPWNRVASRTFTWHDHQVTWLHDALGIYGLCDYLPSNAVFAAYGSTRSGQADDHERLDYRFEATIGNQPAWTALSLTRTQPVIPVSGYSGLIAAGYYRRDATWNGDNGVAPGASLALDQLISHHHVGWPGRGDQPYHLSILWNRTTQVLPVMPQRPRDWPALHLASARLLGNAHFQSLYRVRWTDTATGEVAELAFSGLGTTLRGARQQRRPAGGWAAWYALGDPRNQPTLDAPP